MTDYVGNSNKDKAKTLPEKNITPISGEVKVAKKPLGKKIKETFIKTDMTTMVQFVIYDLAVPAMINFFLDAMSKGSERLFYGDSGRRGGIGLGSRVTSYQTPITRGYPEPLERGLPSRREFRGPGARRSLTTDYVLESREVAESVLEQMSEILNAYNAVSVADLNAILHQPSGHTDQKWGWISLGGSQIQQVREGFLLDFPNPEPIQ